MTETEKIICDLKSIRKAKKISQYKLQEITGIKQTVIARIEVGKETPKLSTILKILNSLGYTLKVVKIE